RRHTRSKRDWSSDVCSSDLILAKEISAARREEDWAISALTARFAGYLTFGTAGLRAPVGPGTTRMNRVVVQQAAAGIADFAHERSEVRRVGRVLGMMVFSRR